MTFTVTWHDIGREPQSEPDPRYPKGVDIDASKGAKRACSTSLPYPARRCGYYTLICTTCKLTAVVTTAGRPDDPRSFKVACKETQH